MRTAKLAIGCFIIAVAAWSMGCQNGSKVPGGPVNVGLSAQGTNVVIRGRLSDLCRRNVVRRADETFWVRGEVRYPNLHYVYGTNRSWTVLGAIEAAGGFTAKARKDQVWVRSLSGSLSCVNCLSARTNAQEDKVIAPGSGIYVPRAGF